MRFSTTFLDEIRARLPISDVVGRRVNWDRRKSQPGRGDFWACCPFHDEKTPSFHAEDRKGRYYCFGCNASGDIFTFMVESAGLTFPEAVERLAGDAGVAMPKVGAQDLRREQRRGELADVMELAAAYFEDRLQGLDGSAARGYLTDRGVSAAAQKKFRIGFAPGDRRALKAHLAGNEISMEQMIEAGLLVAGEDIAQPYDRFRDRIMFPITDPRGRVIAFGGRAMNPEARAKYLNSPETPLFQKRRVLYNFAAAREAARGCGALIAVEGYMDVIALTGAGLAHVVAPLGTALTPEQLGKMWRLSGEPVLCFDGDRAGLAAAHRAADMALAHLRPGYSLKFAILPQGADPDDLVRSEGAEAFSAIIEQARPLVDMVWQKQIESGDWTTPERRALLEQKISAILREISHEAVRRHYKEHLRARLRSFQNARTPSFRRHEARGFGRARQEGPERFDTRRPGASRSAATEALKTSALVRGGPGHAPQREALLVLALVTHPHILERHGERFSLAEFSTPALDRLRREILDIAADCDPLDTVSMTAQLRQSGAFEEVERLRSRLTHKADWFIGSDAAPGDAETAWLHMLSLHEKSSTLRRELRAAERALSQEGTEENFNRLRALNAELATSEGREAVIEGFGEASNRGSGS